MTRVSPLFRFMPYGAPELLDASRPNMARALVVASTLGALVFALLGVLRLANPSIAGMPKMPSIEIIPGLAPEAPTLEPFEHQSPIPPAAPSKTGSVIDEIVPDPLVSDGQTFAPPDITSSWGPPTDVHGGEVVLDGRAPVETLPERGAFIVVDVMPEVLRQVEPIYPELPKTAGISGFVLVQILVGSNGRVVNAVVDEQRNDPLFNEAAMAAARQFVFRPASTNGRAVAVWVTQGFRFTSH